MGNLNRFERLRESAELIVRHPDFPGKRQALDQCLEDVEDLTRCGQITAAQAVALRGVLAGALAAC